MSYKEKIEEAVTALRKAEEVTGWRFARFDTGLIMLSDYNEKLDKWETIIPLGEVIERL